MFGAGHICATMSLSWSITSTPQISMHSRSARLLIAWVLYTLLWTASALKITQPVPGETIDISFIYNVTWSWTEQDAYVHLTVYTVND